MDFLAQFLFFFGKVEMFFSAPNEFREDLIPFPNYPNMVRKTKWAIG